MKELANDTAVAAVENSADGFVDGSPMNKKGPNEEENNVEPAVDILADCHPCYFHVRMYGEADYFMIDDLKIKAEEKVLASLVNCSEVDSFSQIIAELYSGRADYERLRKLALKVIVDNLPTLRKGFTPVINAKLMESVPDFAVDLCLPTIDNLQPSAVYTTYPDLSAFKEAGGKIIHYHGESDPSIPTGSSVHYHESVRKIMYPDLTYNQSTDAMASFYRLYLVPAASHCATNAYEPGPWPQNNMAVMIDWVEKGVSGACYLERHLPLGRGEGQQCPDLRLAPLPLMEEQWHGHGMCVRPCLD
ncbi:hypothetical protein AnigIFM60653_009362 [Aspergillus niger]|nr:hypothetical protein AnigIFM60653_009362 [Aspergillus niger]